MTEEVKTEDVKTEDVKTDDVKTDVKKDVDSIPYARFKEINDALKESNDAIDKMKADQKSVKEKELTEQGKYKELLETKEAELKIAAEQAKQWKEYQDSHRKMLIELIPEDDRVIYEGLSLEALEKHVTKIGKKPVVLGVDNSTPGEADALGFETPQEAAKAFAAGKIEEDVYHKVRDYFKSKLQR